ncbi:hypothetical protein [Viscerimonas tarda]
MARAIAETPELTGEMAKKFRIDMIESLGKKMTQGEVDAKMREIEEMRKSYELMVSISSECY